MRDSGRASGFCHGIFHFGVPTPRLKRLFEVSPVTDVMDLAGRKRKNHHAVIVVIWDIVKYRLILLLHEILLSQGAIRDTDSSSKASSK